MSEPDWRIWLLHSPLSRNAIAQTLGVISFENERTVRVEYPINGRQSLGEFAVHVRPLAVFWDSVLLGELATTHNVSSTVHWPEDEEQVGIRHAGVTADFIEHPDVHAGVYAYPGQQAYCVWGERVEVISQDLSGVENSPWHKTAPLERVESLVRRREQTIIAPLVMELDNRGIDYSHRIVPFAVV